MSYKVPACRRPEYTILLQEIEDTTWAHCEVSKWSASIAKRMRADVDTLFEMQGAPVYAINEPYGDRKHQKFLELMGFHFHKDISPPGGTIPIYRRG